MSEVLYLSEQLGGRYIRHTSKFGSISAETISKSFGEDNCVTVRKDLKANNTPPPLLSRSFLKTV